ncbi:hypothetical protein QQF64_021836 [Cirrhinus molitorella]|uniref:Uncharacterized protein n=1 Tax=Cirrhinus molitorella TaxID=172907 RepID=A0ABR3L6R2_9TELE
MADRDALPLPLEVRARLAELELELSEVHQQLGKQAVPHNCIAIYAISTLQKLHFYHKKMHRHSNAA